MEMWRAGRRFGFERNALIDGVYSADIHLDKFRPQILEWAQVDRKFQRLRLSPLRLAPIRLSTRRQEYNGDEGLRGTSGTLPSPGGALPVPLD